MRISDWSSDVCSSDLGTSTAGDYLGGATLSAISPDWSRSRTVAGLPATARASPPPRFGGRSEEHTSELQSLMRISYAVFCLKKKKTLNMSIYVTSIYLIIISIYLVYIISTPLQNLH